MSTSFSFSQDKELKIIGVVTDTQNNPLPGVSVLIKGTSTGVVSNLDGKYVISIPNQNSTLIYSYTGFAKQEIAVKGKRVLNVILKESVKELNEIIVVGYGAMKRGISPVQLLPLPQNPLKKEMQFQSRMCCKDKWQVSKSLPVPERRVKVQIFGFAELPLSKVE